MRWLWWRQQGASEELQEAKAALAKARADEPKVAAIVENTKAAMKRNGFGPKIHKALGVSPR